MAWFCRSATRFHVALGQGRFYCSSLQKPTSLRKDLVLGIETSCDDTGVALVTHSGQVVAEALSSSFYQQFVEYGGVVPHVARRQHQHALGPMLQRLLQQAGMESGPASSSSSSSSTALHNSQGCLALSAKLAAVAVTTGPGRCCNHPTNTKHGGSSDAERRRKWRRRRWW